MMNMMMFNIISLPIRVQNLQKLSASLYLPCGEFDDAEVEIAKFAVVRELRNV